MCDAVANAEERRPVSCSMVEAERIFSVAQAPMAAGRRMAPCDTPAPGRRGRTAVAAHRGSDR